MKEPAVATVNKTFPHPHPEYGRYGVEIMTYLDDEGFLVSGHGRRSYAALKAMLRECARWSVPAADKKKILEKWVRFHEECGCTPERHAEHRESDGWCADECEHPGLPPCGEEYAWVARKVEPGVEGAVPVLEFYW